MVFYTGEISPVTGHLLVYSLPSLSKQQHSPVGLIQQVPDVDPQVPGFISSGAPAACGRAASVGLPHVDEQRRCLRHQLWQVRRAVPQAQLWVHAQLMELLQLLEGFVEQAEVCTTQGRGALGISCRHNGCWMQGWSDVSVCVSGKTKDHI